MIKQLNLTNIMKMAYSYKTIKSVSFESLDDMSEILFRNQNTHNYQYIKSKVAEFLVDNGNKYFVEIYNETQKTKNYTKALDIFKI